MKLTLNNFFYGIRQLVMGGGVGSDGVTPRNDAGFAVDTPLPLGSFTGGSVNSSAVKQTVTIPVQLSDLVNAGTWKIAVPFAATISAALFRTGKPASTAAKAATLTVTTNGGTAVTGGVITLTSANQNTTGGTAAATAISGAGATIAAGQTIEFAVSSVTAFVEGDGYVEYTVVNNDLTAVTGLTASETNLGVISAAANTTAIGSMNFVIPRDYDEATDSFAFHVNAASAGATDTQTLTATVYRKRVGANIVTVGTVTGKIRGSSTTTTLSAAAKELIFDLSRNGLRRGDSLTIVLTSDAHTTDAVLVYSAQATHRSTLVSYNETDGAKPSVGNNLR